MPNQSNKTCPTCGIPIYYRATYCHPCDNRRRARERIDPNDPGPNPSGLCMCGCQQKTNLARQTYPSKGWVIGKPMRYVAGHQSRWQGPEYEIRDMGYLTACHVSLRGVQSDGYARYRVNGRSTYAHVLAWEAINGAVPKGLELDHLCRIHACRNPEHLEAVTHTENMRRSTNAILTMDQVRAIRTHLGTISRAELASQFGVDKSTIDKIATGNLWHDAVGDHDPASV